MRSSKIVIRCVVYKGAVMSAMYEHSMKTVIREKIYEDLDKMFAV